MAFVALGIPHPRVDEFAEAVGTFRNLLSGLVRRGAIQTWGRMPCPLDRLEWRAVRSWGVIRRLRAQPSLLPRQARRLQSVWASYLVKVPWMTLMTTLLIAGPQPSLMAPPPSLVVGRSHRCQRIRVEYCEARRTQFAFFISKDSLSLLCSHSESTEALPSSAFRFMKSLSGSFG